MIDRRANPSSAVASRTVPRIAARTVKRAGTRTGTSTKSRGAARRIAPDPTRSKLLHAAGDVFAEVGYHAATVREISRRAGANVAAVNYHFGDKLELYTAVLRETMQGPSLEAVRIALNRQAPPEETIAEVIKAMLARICSGDNRDRRWRLMMHEQSRRSISGLLANIALTIGETAVAARTLEARSASSLQSRFACTVAVISIMSSARRPFDPSDDFIAA